MLRKTIKYKNLFTDEEEEGTFYFNLTKADLVEMEAEAGKEGMKDRLTRIVEAQNNSEILKVFNDILRRAYGVRSEDGKRLIKSDEVWEEFRGSEAYSELIMEFFTNDDAASTFIEAIMPSDMIQAARAELAAVPDPPINQHEKPEPKALTPADMREMDRDELQSGLATGRYIIAAE